MLDDARNLKEATGKAEPVQPRPVTLFTGQWADLPFEEVCRLASEWGYDGLEIACWGDHFDVAKAAEDEGYVRGQQGHPRAHGLGCWAISNHLNGQAVCEAIIDDRYKNMVNPRVWGDGDPEGVRQRAAEEMKTTARAAAAFGVDTVVGFTGSAIWHYVAMFPPVEDKVIQAGYADFADRWNPIIDVFDEVGVRFAHEVHPSEIAYDYWSTIATLEAIDHRAGFGLNFDPSHMVWQDLDYVRLPVGFPRPDLPRGLQGHQDPDEQRPQRPAVLASAVGRSTPRLGLHLDRTRRHPLGRHLPDAQPHRLRRPDLDRMGGRRHGPARRRSRGSRLHPQHERHSPVGSVLRRSLRHQGVRLPIDWARPDLPSSAAEVASGLLRCNLRSAREPKWT